ncbi:choice-of-anchor A family protein [Streptomyces sp. NPDC001568]|uniref:choice-of-anchor A family protein n=1 Tax=Streptomyces sp. NPDC001568 TaxID=3364588 RepID=UPI0036C825D5
MSISVRSTLTSTLLGGSLVLAPTGARAATPLDGAGRAVRSGAQCPDVLGVARLHAEFIEDDARHAPGADGAVEPNAGPSATEFTALREASAALAGVRADEVGPSPRGGHLWLIGTDARYNAFSVPAAELEKSRKVHLDVPEGAVTVVNVTGATYDQGATRVGGFLFLDENADAAEGARAEADGGADSFRSRLLWNFPAATKIVKRGANSWPGTVLAPHAAVDLGEGGPLEGGVIARSLSGQGSAGTRHHPFTGCLPTAPGPTGDAGGSRTRAESGPPRPPTPVSSAAPTSGPTAAPTPVSSAVPTPGPTAGSSTSVAPTGPGPAAPTASRDRGPSAVPATGAAGPGGPDGGLALTGAGKAVPLAIGGAAVLAAGAAMVLVARRRRA